MALNPVASPKRRLFKLPLDVLNDVFASGLILGVLRVAERGVLFLCDCGVARLARLAGVAFTLIPSFDVWLLTP
jgi:hypothetical protein